MLGAWLHGVIPVVQVARPVGPGLGPVSAAEAYGAPRGEKAIGRPLGGIALRVRGTWRGNLRVLVGRVLQAFNVAFHLSPLASMCAHTRQPVIPTEEN